MTDDGIDALVRQIERARMRIFRAQVYADRLSTDLDDAHKETVLRRAIREINTAIGALANVRVDLVARLP